MSIPKNINSACPKCNRKICGGNGVRIIDIVPQTTRIYLTTLWCPGCDTTWKTEQRSHETQGGYYNILTPTGQMTEHRWLWIFYNGPIPNGSFIHHLNGVKSDNRLENITCITSGSHTKLRVRKSDLIIQAQYKRIRQLEKELEERKLDKVQSV